MFIRNSSGGFSFRTLRIITICFAFFCTHTHAEEAEDSSSDEQPIIEDLVIVAHPLSSEGLAQNAQALSGDALADAKDTNIGATLAKLPGIRSSNFGKAVGRPVIHGLGGPRVRIMEDRIDTLDVSVTSADHAVGVEPFIADRIEILKGSSTLLYGSGAIGGVVDVHTGRIPHQLNPLSGGIESFFDHNSEGWSTAAELTGSVGNFSWHVDGTFKDGDEYEIPGFAESANQRAAEAAEEEEHEEEHDEEEHEEEEEVRGILPGSQYDSENFAFGGSYVGEWGFFGISVSDTDADYGLPGGHGHEHEEEEHEEGEEEHEEEEEEGNPTLELEQTRIDAELAIRDPFGPFTSFNLRLGHNDYKHQELEPNGEVGSTFENDAWELRGELVYELENWRGAFGIQHTDRDFSAVGEEAFIAPVETTDTGIFWVGEYSFDSFDLEMGARLNRLEHDPSAASSESFTDFSTSVGVVMPLSTDNEGGWQLGVIIDYSNRAPVAEELYSNGPHLVTNAFEVGNPNLDSETAVNLSATLQHSSDRWDAAVTVYHTEFTDFIYEQATGEIEDDLPVFTYLQNDATFTGLDLQANVQVMDWDNGGLSLGVQADLLNASIDTRGNDNVPRTPPSRYGLNAAMTWGNARAGIRYLRNDPQRSEAPGEFDTGGYDDLSAHIEFKVWAQNNSNVTLFVRGRNLTDDEQRDHVSFIKDFAPAPGRTIETGIRARF